MPGKLKWVGSGRNILVGVNSNDDIYYRAGMSATNPTGTKWVKVSGKLMQIDVYENEVVGTNSGNAIYRCPVSPGKIHIHHINKSYTMHHTCLILKVTYL